MSRGFFKPLSYAGISRSRGGHVWLRKGLVTFQFTASGVLLVGTLIVQKQIDYALNKDLGYHRRYPHIIPEPDS